MNGSQAGHFPRRQNLMPAACAVFALWIVAAILSSRCLYADGAHEFLRVLQAQDFVALMWSRHFAFYIYEFPLVLAIKLGVTDLGWLRFAFGLGCFLPWPVVMLFCHWLSPKHFWIVAVGCAAGYLNASFMAVGEHILAHAFYWPALFAILFARPLKPLAALILLTSASCLLFSYESQLFLCVPLAALSFWRVVEDWKDAAEQNAHWDRIVLLLAAGLFIAAAGIGLYAVLNPEIPSNIPGFRANVEAMFSHEGWILTWSIVWGCLMLAVWMSEKTWEIISRQISIAILFCALFVWAMWPALSPETLDTGKQFDNRILDLVVPMMLLPVALIARYRPAWIEFKAGRLKQMAAILLIVQSLWQICATWQWHEDVGKMQSLLRVRDGIIPLYSTVLANSSIESKRGEFDWTWPCLSIALSPGLSVHSMVCSDYYIVKRRHPLWQPFDPLKPETLPHLEHYGLDFSKFAGSLEKASLKQPPTAP